MRLLIVEDDLELAAALQTGLERRGLASDHARSLHDAGWMLKDVGYAALILDLGLTDGDGLHFLAHLRAQNTLPVLILTARADLPDRLAGLDAGADDYLTKPFDMDELVARLRAILRRTSFQGHVLHFADLSYDTRSRELQIDGQSLPISARESELIELLLKRSGRVITKRLAEDQLFGLSEQINSNAVEVYMHRLRKKLQQAGSAASIETVRGVGYMLRRAP